MLLAYPSQGRRQIVVDYQEPPSTTAALYESAVAVVRGHVVGKPVGNRNPQGTRMSESRLRVTDIAEIRKMKK